MLLSNTFFEPLIDRKYGTTMSASKPLQFSGAIFSKRLRGPRHPEVAYFYLTSLICRYAGVQILGARVLCSHQRLPWPRQVSSKPRPGIKEDMHVCICKQ